ncbi:hypothetical protein SAMN04488498_108176 [Mesorhizobium albiziae]|uniref:Uncharacterized protein n=2 Tax=Neomesorhizobium albiziae TaxID=335020 RepID=A0A1I4AQ44_9HYPH|nr:hypothetical protein [Mesorhizobium albiziae]SFK57776.1 hypothetical protein SAMN04488498_108176 [Mesorhizobium albiziae]
MTSRISEISVHELLKTFLKYENLRLRAVRRLDVPATNRNFLKAVAASDSLSQTAAGRAEIEKLLTHPMPYIRVRAAGAVMTWAPEKAIPVFGRMLDADLSAISSVDERLDIRIDSQDWLYQHFQIRSSDRNDLIEPLKAYGIELSYRDRTGWR